MTEKKIFRLCYVDVDLSQNTKDPGVCKRNWLRNRIISEL